MAARQIVPALGLDSFSCPHLECGAIAHQTWYKLHVLRHEKESRPWLPGEEALRQLKADKNTPPSVITHLEKVMQRNVFFETHSYTQLNTHLVNIHASRCYSCDRIALWRADELIYPVNHISVAPPTEDMPDDVKADFLEANEILDKSPRGAAALLRLSIQKLMVHLGEKGKNINGDIASLVQKGLDKRIQKALDVVRVVGNNAVHPGQIDLNDDKTIATSLFRLVNVIVESQITQAKHIDEMFNKVVPEHLKAEIEKRDVPKQIENKPSEG
jgi:hypothetical protein